MLHAYWSLCVPVPNMIKIFQTIKKLWNAQEFGLEIRLGQIIKKKKKKKEQSQELSLHATLLLDLIYVPIKLSQTIWELQPAQDFGFKGRELHKGQWELSHVTPHLVLIYTFTKYQNISNH